MDVLRSFRQRPPDPAGARTRATVAPSSQQRDVLVWDPTSDGHHRRYLEAVIQAAPSWARLTTPGWAAELDSMRPGVVVGHLRPTYVGEDRRELMATLRVRRPDVVLAMEAHQLIRRLALRPLPRGLAFVGLDLRGTHGLLGNPRAYLPSLRFGHLASAVAGLTAREVLVRRQNCVFLSLNGWTVRVGTKLLRSRTFYAPDPIEHLPDVQERPEPEAGAPEVLGLIGVLDRRKGLHILAEALEYAYANGSVMPQQVELLIAGACRPGYETELASLVESVRDKGFNVSLELGHMTVSDLAHALDRTSILVLPYPSHFGSSGLLGSSLRFPRLRVVCSDFGWLGAQAKAAGAVLFRNGDARDLARAIAEVISGNAETGASVDLMGYAQPDAFGRAIWDAVTLAVNASSGQT